ncbi:MULTISPECIES: (2Fe-2S) ferredoxin domain-containing protein [Kamptonema]|uniref:(2Fe-2S) ferredoxin domain-containing protein n=1 Tax=Kamptonema TaxID=1501433 RepID=UPI0001DAD62B|nr:MULTISPECIES: (2Fe-2S) ferredoxin domain-containing protein [Kamptonema]CBN56574.1 putative iron-sulfur cluster-binding protein [Kamptonema sp. PCC 6506]
MGEFSRFVTPLNRCITEPLLTGGQIEYEDFPCTIDVTGPLLYALFQERWQETQIGHVVEGGVLELEFTQPPKICILYDGYLTVVTEAWHLHLCLEEHLGGPLEKTPPKLRQQRLIHRASLYRRLNEKGEARSWGIQFWNGAGEKMMNLFLPSPFVGEDEDLLPEGKPQLEKLSLYQELREIYVLGSGPIPFENNPLKRPYISVCRSSRCHPSRNWQPIIEALQTAVKEAGMDVYVMTSGCLEVCKMGPVVFYSGDRTWYTRVTPAIAQRIVHEHLGQNNKVIDHLYPPVSKSTSKSEAL